MKFCADVRGLQRMNPSDFSDPLTFPLAPSAGHLLDDLSLGVFDDPLTYNLPPSAA